MAAAFFIIFNNVFINKLYHFLPYFSINGTGMAELRLAYFFFCSTIHASSIVEHISIQAFPVFFYAWR